MKRFITAYCLFFSAALNAQTNAPLTQFDITSYSVNIDFVDEYDTLDVGVIVRYRLVNPNCKEINLSLVGLNPQTGTGMKVSHVTCSSLGGNIPFRQTKDELIIPAQTDPDKQWFYVHYRGAAADGIIIGKNKFGDRTFFTDTWPDRAPHWLACVNHPGDKAEFVWSVEAPEHYTVSANGILTMETHAPQNRKMWTFIQQEPIAVKVAAVAVARFDCALQETVNCVPVYEYYFPQSRENRHYKFDSSATILKFFTALIGEYPYKKLSNLQSTISFGGMENAGNIFYDQESVDGDRDCEALVAHETIHQWFGNSVSEKSFAHVWLSEGFATFLTNYYIEKKYGKDSLNKRLKKDWERSLRFSANNNRSVVDNTSDFMSLLTPNSYEKGGLFLQALREKIGDSLFFSIIRTFYGKYKFKNADTEDFRAVVESLTRKNWKEFFNDWLYKPKLPEKYLPPK